MGEAKRAVQAGRWILYRFNPEARYEGKNPLHVDSPLGAPTLPLADYMSGENRFKGLMRDNPELAKELIKRAESEYAWRRDLYKQLAAIQRNVFGIHSHVPNVNKENCICFIFISINNLEVFSEYYTSVSICHVF